MTACIEVGCDERSRQSRILPGLVEDGKFLGRGHDIVSVGILRVQINGYLKVIIIIAFNISEVNN